MIEETCSEMVCAPAPIFDYTIRTDVPLLMTYDGDEPILLLLDNDDAILV